ncbi:nicotinamide-nucleotide adenylyltransferase [Micromonospora ureilytica]|uniref:nicotinamide-nucleotide adenylyltransferase n=1 Tax=Micromonospora ureilytica TaxID=709868 RepID=UPI003411E9EB
MRSPITSSCVLPGRFQPFHIGHAAALDHALSRYDRVVVAISNAHVSHLPTDPFTGGERYQMIHAYAAAISAADRVAVIPVAVDDEPTTWVATIRAICPPFQEVYTRSPWTQAHFAYWGIPTSSSLLLGHETSGSEVRQEMSTGGDWRRFVPPSVAHAIEQFDGHQRMHALAKGSNYRTAPQPTTATSHPPSSQRGEA